MKRAQLIVTTCDRRAFEVEQTKQFLRLNGYLVSDYHKKVDTQAELIVLFTCGFTQVAEELGFDLLKKIENAKRTGSKVVFGGCIPAINPKRTSKEFQGPTFTPRSYSNLDEIIGAQHRFEEVRMPNVCCRSARSNTRTTLNGVLAALRQFDYSFSGLKNFQKWLRFIRLLATLKSAYSIQIEKGCSMECTYCAIRKAVGPLRSKIPEGVIDELQIGLDTGHKVFTLYGDNAGSYGLDKGTNLGPLLDQVAQVNGQFQLHLTDISPVYLPLMYTQAIALCRRGVLVSMYVPIQSGSSRILNLMRRPCDIDGAKHMLTDIKAASKNKCRIGTSVIVGFPSETTEDFLETVAFCKEVRFDWIWCHEFSARPDTPAELTANPLSHSEVSQRAKLFRSELRESSFVRIC